MEKIFNLNDFDGLNFFVAWKRSKVWGYCPSIYLYNPQEQKTKKYYASGCGYDKRSTVVSRALNDNPYCRLLFAEYRAKVERGEIAKDYGIEFEKDSNGAYLCGGVGCECYPRIFASVGYSFKWYSADYSDSDFVQIERIK